MKNILHIVLGLVAGAALVLSCSAPMSPGTTPPNTPLDLPFTSDNGGAYLAQGTAAVDNFNLVTIGAMPAITVHATSVTANGTTGETASWNLSGPTDLSAQNYTVTFNYYIPSSPATSITGIRMEFYSATYTPIYFNATTTLTPADTWLPFSMTVSGANIAYDGFSGSSTADPAAWTALTIFRITATSASAGSDLVLYVTNVKVTNGP